jgi:integrase
VDLDRRVVVIRRSKTKVPRQIPLTPRAVEVLRTLRLALPTDLPVGAGRVFANVNSDHGGSRVSKALQKAAIRAGFPSLRLHDLRHAFASGLSQAGVAPGVIGAILGDTSPSVIFRYSRHAPIGAEAEAVRRLSESRVASAATVASTRGGEAQQEPQQVALAGGTS